MLGHKGCGKSTELNRLSTKLEAKGYKVKTIVCSMDLDLLNIVYSDLFILMGEALLQIAEECGCNISEAILDDIEKFWDEGTKTTSFADLETVSLETGASVETKRAERRRSDVISMEDADRALEELKTSLTRRIEKKDYEFLINIYKGNKELIEDKEMLLKMLQASIVLEYNGKRWHNAHPLVIKFFEEQGMIADV